MRRGVNALLFTAALTSAGCVTDTGKLEIRPVADPYSKATKAGNPAVAEGRGLLAVGSVGLAIEAFRKALREQPDSIEALAGLAECYDQMGRHDLSRAKYEAALAIAPNNTTLLRTFAASLERQGRYAEAIALRAEASATERTEAAALARLAPAAPFVVPVQPQPVPADVAAVPKPHAPVQIATVAAKAPAPVKMAQAEPKPAPPPLKTAALEPELAAAPIRIADAQVRLTSAPVVGKTEWRIEAPVLAPLSVPSVSVTVKLPPVQAEPSKVAAAPHPSEPAKTVAEDPRIAELKAPNVRPSPVEAPEVAAAPPIETSKVAPSTSPRAEPSMASASNLPRVEIPKVAVAAGPSVTVKLPPVRPEAAMPEQKPTMPERRMIVEATTDRTGPRLERLSLAEVALVTDPRPRLRSEAVRQSVVGSTPRFVSLAELQRNSGIRVLNAARRKGIAARTRFALNQQGWNRVTIGNSARVRQKSLVLYSAATEQAARRLAAKYGIWIAKEARPGPLTILLGRDWISRRQPRA